MDNFINYQKLEKIAREDFEWAFRKGYWHAIIAWFSNRENSLLPYDEIRKRMPLTGQHDIGLRQIEIDRIVGSVGRYNDFDRAFLPREQHTRSRWVSIDKAHLQDIILPPIEVYKLGDLYFVRDGNHRVSVARERGQAFIDANVTEVDVLVPVDPQMDIDELIRLQEKAWFLQKTGLDRLRPTLDFNLTLPGQYEKLLQHIEVHRYFLGEQLQREISEDEAVQSWCDTVYLPLVENIRAQNTLEEFPQRSETDLYLWIIEHLYYLREQYQQEISPAQAVEHFSANYSTRPDRRIWSLFKKIARLLSGGLETTFDPLEKD